MSEALADFSQYEKHEIVGKGAYGCVYRGIHRPTGELVALKVIDLDHPDNEDIDEIRREVNIISSLKDATNNNITRYYGCWVVGYELWIAMDFASGGSIRTLMKAGQVEERLTVIIIREVLLALAYLHKENVIHRDIKAANILLTQAGKILLCDFGVAAHIKPNAKRQTFIGTPYWMAPEVILEAKLYDTKADLWSLGITVYEIATGMPPLSNLEPLRAIAKIARSEPPKLEDKNCSANMKEFVALALIVDPAQRPSAEELSKSRWIKGANRMPSALLRELVVRYGGWINAGGVRTSIIGNVAKLDDTFEMDMDRPSSWLFDEDDSGHIEILGDEPYLSKRNRTSRDIDAPTARPQTAQKPYHPLMRLFDKDEGTNSSISTGSTYLSASNAVTDWSNGETLRPKSIAIPNFEDSPSGGVSIPNFDDDSSTSFGGFGGWSNSAWAANSGSAWTQASEFRVGAIPMENELITPGGDGLAPDDASDGSIQSPPPTASSPTEQRPPWANNDQPAWASATQNAISLFGNNNSQFSSPNPFPKSRNGRQDSYDSVYGVGGGPGGPAFAASPQSIAEDAFKRADSPQSYSFRNKVASSTSLPSLSRPKQGSDDFVTSKRIISPPADSPSFTKARSNTAPLHDPLSNPTPPLPPVGEKHVLNFNKPNPFAQNRNGIANKPAALRIPSVRGALADDAALTPRSGLDFDEDVLTPMPASSPITVSTPTTGSFPFPSLKSIKSSLYRQDTISTTSMGTPDSAATSVRSRSSIDWDAGSPIMPFDYPAMTESPEVSNPLQRVMDQLAAWLASVDSGLGDMLEECA